MPSIEGDLLQCTRAPPEIKHKGRVRRQRKGNKTMKGDTPLKLHCLYLVLMLTYGIHMKQYSNICHIHCYAFQSMQWSDMVPEYPWQGGPSHQVSSRSSCNGRRGHCATPITPDHQLEVTSLSSQQRIAWGSGWGTRQPVRPNPPPDVLWSNLGGCAVKEKTER